MRRLEGTSVQRFAVEAGDTKIEIERGGAAPVAAPPRAREAPAVSGHVAPSAGGMGVAPGARGASGAFAAITDDGRRTTGSRCSRRSSGPSTARPSRAPSRSSRSATTVEAGQTVCIVEAMKLMNEVAAAEGGQGRRDRWSRTASRSSSSRC